MAEDVETKGNQGMANTAVAYVSEGDAMLRRTEWQVTHGIEQPQ